MSDAVVVAVDGPSGSGKSSAARGVACALELRYLDTGAMYRAVTWWMLQAGVPVDDPVAVASRCGEPALAVGTDPRAPTLAVDGVDVSAPIRSREVSNAVSAVSAVPEVRARLVEMQREIIRESATSGGIVVEGRDIGTVVAPEASLKVFLTASSDTRVHRRSAELSLDPGGQDATRDEMARRDRLDATRTASPLTRADGSVEIDSTELALDEVIDTVLRLVRERRGAPSVP